MSELTHVIDSKSAGIWHSDNIRARVFARPRNTDAVAAALSICHRHDQRTVTQGGLMRSLKRALDPKGLLNPGKIFEMK